MNAYVLEVGCGASVLLDGVYGGSPSAVAWRQARVLSQEQLGGVLALRTFIISDSRLCDARAIGVLSGAAMDTLALLRSLLLDLSGQQPGRFKAVGQFESR